MLSVLLGPKLITLSSFQCIKRSKQKSNQLDPRRFIWFINRFTRLVHNWLSTSYIKSWGVNCKPGVLDLSRSCLNQESRSQHRQTVCLEVRENLDIFKKFVLTVEKSPSRSRLLNFVSASMSKIETCRDMLRHPETSRSQLVLTVETSRLS